jgi:hypothetical protein
VGLGAGDGVGDGVGDVLASDVGCGERLGSVDGSGDGSSDGEALGEDSMLAEGSSREPEGAASSVGDASAMSVGGRSPWVGVGARTLRRTATASTPTNIPRLSHRVRRGPLSMSSPFRTYRPGWRPARPRAAARTRRGDGYRLRRRRLPQRYTRPPARLPSCRCMGAPKAPSAHHRDRSQGCGVIDQGQPSPMIERNWRRSDAYGAGRYPVAE